MNKILVPTDFSANSTNALVYAMEVARKFNSQVILLNAYSIPYSGSTIIVDITDMLKEEAWKGLEGQYELVKHKYSDVKVNMVAEYGAAADIIAGIVETYHIDMVVMGTKGAHGLKGVILGSVTAAAAKRLRVPLLAIPEDVEYKNPKRFVMATDYKLNHPEQLLPLEKLMSAFGGEIDFVNVSDNVKDASLDALESEFKAKVPGLLKEIHTFRRVQSNDVENGIINHLVNHPVDIMVVVSHHRGFFENIFHRSMAKRLTLHTALPLLFIND
jgi:nucleotide-binding universal stress UspA family protein